jgi:hypothetical protein
LPVAAKVSDTGKAEIESKPTRTTVTVRIKTPPQNNRTNPLTKPANWKSHESVQRRPKSSLSLMTTESSAYVSSVVLTGEAGTRRFQVNFLSCERASRERRRC